MTEECKSSIKGLIGKGYLSGKFSLVKYLSILYICVIGPCSCYCNGEWDRNNGISEFYYVCMHCKTFVIGNQALENLCL